MVVLRAVHLLFAVLGLGTAGWLLVAGTERIRQLTSAMWVGFVGVVGSGIVMALPSGDGGTGASVNLLAGKVLLSLVLAGAMYWWLPDVGDRPEAEQRMPLLVLTGLWVVVLVLGVLMVF
ncbi:MAG: hypothetical protein ABEI31_01390 [Halodesulfurarchaeum sp.]